MTYLRVATALCWEEKLFPRDPFQALSEDFLWLEGTIKGRCIEKIYSTIDGGVWLQKQEATCFCIDVREFFDAFLSTVNTMMSFETFIVFIPIFLFCALPRTGKHDTSRGTTVHKCTDNRVWTAVVIDYECIFATPTKKQSQPQPLDHNDRAQQRFFLQGTCFCALPVGTTPFRRRSDLFRVYIQPSVNGCENCMYVYFRFDSAENLSIVWHRRGSNPRCHDCKWRSSTTVDHGQL